jgi:hypothetical protein
MVFPRSVSGPLIRDSDFTSNWISDISHPLGQPHRQPKPSKMARALDAPDHLQNTSPTTIPPACEVW